MGIVMMLAMIGFTSCDDFLDITPTGKVISNRVGQQAFEAAYPDKDFISIFGRNYL